MPRLTVLAALALLVGCPDYDAGFDFDGDGWDDGVDCAPEDPAIHPAAAEIPNAEDDDCDGEIDEGTSARDDDGDGACEGADNEVLQGCSDGSTPGDCDDTDDDLNLLDVDGDGVTTCDPNEDCDDLDASVNPGADELCDGIDNDCDGAVPDDEADADFDGLRICDGDCDDADAWTYPGAAELTDCLDNDCDAEVDEGLDSVDDDGDGACEGADLGGDELECCSNLEVAGDCDDEDHAAYPQDLDGDGMSTCDGDCDDDDPLTFHDADEQCDGLDNDCDVFVPTDFATIQDAIDASADGDGICVEPGVYYENIDFDGHNVRVVGLQGPEVTTMDGQDLGSVVVFDSGETSAAELSGFTLTGGLATQGGGVLVTGNSSPSLRELVITNCEATGDGGGILLEASTAEIADSVIQQCVAGADGGGLAVAGGSPTIARVVVSDGMADLSAGRGGGVYLHDNASVTISDCSFNSNTAYRGGGIYMIQSSCTIYRSRFVGNSSPAHGGGIRATEATFVMEGCLFGGNSAEYGAGIALYESTNTLRNVALVGNSAVTGGAIYSRESEATLSNTLFEGNTATHGGGVYALEGTAAPVMTWCAAWNNTPDDYDGFDDPTGTNGNISADPDLLDTSGILAETWDVHLSAASALIDAGDPSLTDPDGTISDIGAYGGPNAGSWDLDGDGYPEWWQPGPYDYATYPALGWDCDDGDPEVFPGSGC